MPYHAAVMLKRELLHHPGARIGMIYIIHTGGRDLGYKTHVHLVMTKGMISQTSSSPCPNRPPGLQ
jgi:hypothetical protein